VGLPVRSETTDLHAERLELTAFLGALCLFFSAIEYIFPKPVPFFRLGLANLPILVALTFLPGRYIFLLTLLKVLGQGIINGTLVSYVFLFSAAGSFSSVVLMFAAHRLGGRRISLVGVSVLGALASNAIQIALSILFIFGSSARIIAPLFMSLGLASGLAVGLFAERFSKTSKWYASVREYHGAA
jgi:heptaprenyl diphosphate synthase